MIRYIRIGGAALYQLSYTLMVVGGVGIEPTGCPAPKAGGLPLAQPPLEWCCSRESNPVGLSAHLFYRQGPRPVRREQHGGPRGRTRTDTERHLGPFPLPGLGYTRMVVSGSREGT